MSSLVLTRRQALRASVVAAGTAVVAITGTGLCAPAVASPLPDGRSARAGGVPALTGLPVRYGTPTDIARTTELFVWTLDRDGVVQRFDRDVDAWVPAGRQDWPAVLTFGEAMVARWGRPGGPHQVVLVIGSDPEPPPTTTPTQPTTPTTPSDPTPPTPPTQPATPTITTTNPADAYRYPTPGRVDGGVGSGGTASGNLSYTGFDLGRFGLIGAGLLAAGGALLAVRRRRMATPPPPDPVAPDEAGPPATGP